MKKKWNVLIFPGGVENGLEIQKSLQYCKEVQLFSASSDVSNHAPYVYKENHIIRDVFTEGWIEDLNSIIIQNKIDVIYPANSLIIDRLALHRQELKAPVLLPNAGVVQLTRSKKATIEALKNLIPVPEVYASEEEVHSYPVFCKPDGGYGAQGAELIRSAKQLENVDFETHVVQEFLPGREYTIDCFSDRQGKLLFSGARERSRVRMATAMHAEVVSPDLEILMNDYAKKILSKIAITGAWFFQVKEDKQGQLKLQEVDIRIAGTMCFNRCRGVNFPLLSLYDFFNHPVQILTNDEPLTLDRSLKNRYIFNYSYDAVYVDLDDTLIVHGEINILLIQFLFQCINKKKKIILITKNLEADIHVYLKKFRISEIFDEVCWLKEHQNKTDFIFPEKAIYIDDSFQQRRDVRTRLLIPTFDCSMVEALIDDRY